MIDIAALSMDYWDDLMVRMAHHSTAIEGNTLSQGDTKSLLLDGYIPRAMDLREMHEVLNYKRFMDFLQQSLARERALSLGFIKEVHAVLCKDAIEDVAGRITKLKEAGSPDGGRIFLYRGSRDGVADTIRYLETQCVLVRGVPGSPAGNVRPQGMGEMLAAQLAAAKSAEDKIAAICRQHIRFERIHPFSDGNGRVGRALIVYSCLQEKEAPIVIPVEERKRYMNVLNTEDLQGFVAFAKELQKEEEERLQVFLQKN